MLHHPPIQTDDADLVVIQERLRRFVRRLVADPHEGEEVVSQTLLALLERRRARRLLRRPDAWALRVAWNKLVDLRRGGRRAAETGVDVMDLPAPDPRRNRELREWLDAGLAYLPEVDRALLHLRYAEELSDRDIARILQCPRGTVARRLHDARRRLGVILERLGGGVSVASVLTLLGALDGRTQAAMTLASSTAAVGVYAGVLAMKKVVALIVAVALLGLLAWKLQEVEPGTPIGGGRAVEFAEGLEDDVGSAADAPRPDAAPVPLDPYEEPPPPSTAPARGIHGRVETPDGTPVAGARVLAFIRASGIPIDLDDERAPLFRGVTGADGRFAIPVMASGRFDVFAQADTHAPTLQRDVVLNQDVVITLHPAIEIRGRVVDEKGGPIGGAKASYRSLLAHARFQRSARTGADGRFVITGLRAPEPTTSQHILVEAEGYAPLRSPISGTPEEEIVIQLSRGAVLEGRVTAKDAPVAGAEVVFWTGGDAQPRFDDEGVWIRNPFGSRILLRTHTDSEGRYRLAGVPMTERRSANIPFGTERPDLTGGHIGSVVAWKAGFAPASAPAREREETQILDLVLHPPARLEGRVVDLDGIPMAGVRVRPVAPGERSYAVQGSPEPFGSWVETDVQGRWQFEHFPCPDGLPTACAVHCCGCPLGLGQDKKLEVLAIPGETMQVGDLEFAARRVHGRVEDTAGIPVEGASVRAKRGSAGVFTGSEGTFALWLPTRDGKLQAHSIEVVAPTYRATVTPIPEDGGLITVVMEPGASIRGRLMQADGAPAGSIPLEAWAASASRPNPVQFRASTDDEGRFVFGGLAPGTYIVAMRPKQQAAPWQTTAQTDGPSVEGVLPPPSGPPLALRILHAWDRAPVVGARASIRVDVNRPCVSPLFPVKKPKGLYLFAEVPPGTHTLTIEAAGFVPYRRPITVGPEPAGEPLEILLGSGTQLSGRVHFPPDIDIYFGTTVTVLEADGRTELGRTEVAADRTYSLAGIPPGPILVRAEAQGLGRDFAIRPPLARLTSLRANEGPQVCDLDLIPAERLALHFTPDPTTEKAASRPTIGPGGAAAKDPKRPAALIVDADGRTWGSSSLYRYEQLTYFLPPGRYTIEVRSGDTVICTTRVTVPGTATITIPSL